ncbi:MAG: sulfatase [Planctomycetota bacterium]
MNRNALNRWGILILAAGMQLAVPVASRAGESQRPASPNVVIIFTDDQGYQDVGCFGSPDIKTPNLDRMAAEGMRFTDFYVTQAVCSASRVGLMTGCYSIRVGILGALGPSSTIGINAEETTIAEVVKQKNYATAAFGKWHLGHHPQFLPTRNGFDEYFGLPYSNDMWPYHPERPNGFPPLPLIENETVVNPNVTADDQRNLTTWYTEHAVDFIERNQARPFFVYLAHSMPHVPLHVSDKFKGKSERGLYGDVIMEIDWSVGQILDTLKRLNLDEKTLVIFTSDNGPWLSYGNHGGSALPLREGKGTMWDGGCREACIMRWPGNIPAGTVCSEVAGTIDILPTVADVTGTSLPPKKIDGKSIWPLMQGKEGAASPREAQFFFWGRELHAVRSGPWKLHFPHSYRSMGDNPPGKDGIPGKYQTAHTGLALYDLREDIGEENNVADKHPEIVERLTALAETARAELGDALTKRQGTENREPGSAGDAQPKKAKKAKTARKQAAAESRNEEASGS